MNESQTEAIAMADAYLNNAALPSYSETLENLRRLYIAYDRYSNSSRRNEQAAILAFGLLNRVPE